MTGESDANPEDIDAADDSPNHDPSLGRIFYRGTDGERFMEALIPLLEEKITNPLKEAFDNLAQAILSTRIKETSRRANGSSPPLSPMQRNPPIPSLQPPQQALPPQGARSNRPSSTRPSSIRSSSNRPISSTHKDNYVKATPESSVTSQRRSIIQFGRPRSVQFESVENPTPAVIEKVKTVKELDNCNVESGEILVKDEDILVVESTKKEENSELEESVTAVPVIEVKASQQEERKELEAVSKEPLPERGKEWCGPQEHHSQSTFGTSNMSKVDTMGYLSFSNIKLFNIICRYLLKPCHKELRTPDIDWGRLGHVIVA